jgi:hypothetical protein
VAENEEIKKALDGSGLTLGLFWAKLRGLGEIVKKL